MRLTDTVDVPPSVLLTLTLLLATSLSGCLLFTDDVEEPPEEEVSGEVTALLEARSAARTEKNWAESDRIRDALAEQGWTVKDTPEGPKLRKI